MKISLIKLIVQFNLAVDTDDLHSDTANLDEEIFEILEKEEEIELTD